MIPRRQFVKLAGSCAAHLGLFAGLDIRAFAQASRPIVAEQAWGRIERIADGVWAVISTPLAGGPDARRTLCNGGIVAGKSGVAIIEGFASPDGAKWIAEQAKLITGRSATHVILTHFHGDHAAGLPGYRDAGSFNYVTTTETRGRLKGGVADVLTGAQLVDGTSPQTIDLAGRKVTITPRSGHTTSDLSIVVDDPAVMFGGDLLWNRMFPNYVDAIPSILSRSVRALSADRNIVRVPGHGPIFGADDLTHYIGVLDVMEEAARKARASGTPAAEAAKSVTLPASLGEWVMFNPNYFEVALRAWERESAK
jgi:glyoxylase-like metal-dependent hydrolase (beta-lactamase superfamily II)